PFGLEIDFEHAEANDAWRRGSGGGHSQLRSQPITPPSRASNAATVTATTVTASANDLRGLWEYAHRFALPCRMKHAETREKKRRLPHGWNPGPEHRNWLGGKLESVGSDYGAA